MTRVRILASIAFGLLGATMACENAATPLAPTRQAPGGTSASFVNGGLPFPYSSFAVPTPQTTGNPIFGISTGPDGNVWVTDADGNEILRVTPNGTITEFPISTANAQPTEIARGPDGNLWFCEYYPNAIARMTTSGVITEFPLPPWLATGGNNGPRGIVTGPDHNLWFAHDAGYIGRMSARGQLLGLYATPTTASGPLIIARGPDGNLWFTEFNVDKVARIKLNGSITEFATPTAGSGPIGIVDGGDGFLYFTERTVSQLGKVSVSGVITEYPTPTPNAVPQRITAFRDGGVWFAEANSGAGQIARVLRGGQFIKEYPLPAPSRPFAIVAAGESTLWFTDNVGAVGKLTVEDDH